jgi:hypothetical protein
MGQPVTLRILAAAALLAAFAPVAGAAPGDVARLSASKNEYTWMTLGAPADSMRGRHDELGLAPRERESLAAVFPAGGLAVGGRQFPPARLSVTFPVITADRCEVVFSAADDSAPTSDLTWVVDSAFAIPAGEFMPGDVVAFGGSVTVLGELGGSVLALGGDVIVREGATVRGHVAIVGGILRQRGDGKIYGQVFAPGGHRRPRLSVARAWEFEEEGFQWRPDLSYDRVDGLRFGAQAGYQRSAFTPRLEMFAGYAFASETWQYRLEVRQRLVRSADLDMHIRIFRLTDTEDDLWVGRTANTLYALVAGSDYRDYFGSDGGEIGATYKYRERGVLSAAYRNTDYRWLEAERNLWHLFRPDHRFRENFSTVDEDYLADWVDRFEERTSALHLSLALEPRESEEHRPRLDFGMKLSGEIAGGALGGEFDYDRWQAAVNASWHSNDVHRLFARAWYGLARRDVPPNKLFFLGGIGSLPGYPQKSMVGDEAFLATVEYRFDYWVNETFDGGIILFCDVGRATFADDFVDLSEFKSDLGVGLGLGEGLRLDVAKGLDHTDRDLRVSLRLGQVF